MSEFNSLNLTIDVEKIDLEETVDTPPEFSTFIAETRQVITLSTS